MKLMVSDPTRCDGCGAKLEVFEAPPMYVNGKVIEGEALRCPYCGSANIRYADGSFMAFISLPETDESRRQQTGPGER